MIDKLVRLLTNDTLYRSLPVVFCVAVFLFILGVLVDAI